MGGSAQAGPARVQCSERLVGARGGRGVGVSLSVVVVLDDRERLRSLKQELADLKPPLRQLVAVGPGETDPATIERLDPTTARRRRQRSMARWLLPFGFLAGLTFTQITDLHTFSALGPWGEPVIGGLLGLISGWMGSFAAAFSVASEDADRIRGLRNRLEEGQWLLVLEPETGQEVPWTTLQRARPKAVVRLGET